MDYLKWILRCIEWQTYGECKIETEIREPFEIGLKQGNKIYYKVITPERIMRVKDGDAEMKALLEEIQALFEIKKQRFVDETFEMVREVNSPLYYQFLSKETSPW